jgi:hypothetical protein
MYLFLGNAWQTSKIACHRHILTSDGGKRCTAQYYTRGCIEKFRSLFDSLLQKTKEKESSFSTAL